MGGCFASTTKTARNSVFGCEIMQNVRLWGGGSMYIYMYIDMCLYVDVYVYLYMYMHFCTHIVFTHIHKDRGRGRESVSEDLAGNCKRGGGPAERGAVSLSPPQRQLEVERQQLLHKQSSCASSRAQYMPSQTKASCGRLCIHGIQAHGLRLRSPTMQAEDMCCQYPRPNLLLLTLSLCYFTQRS